jgi:Na+/proline symporter
MTEANAQAVATPFFDKGEIRGVVYGLLSLFFILAGIAVPCMVRHLKSQGQGVLSAKGVDFWFTARNSQSGFTVALSMCATGAGAWLLYTPAEAAYVGGWWGVIGYCVAISLGPLFMAIYGPKMRRQCSDGANITDWVADRFGPVAHFWVSLVFVYYMFIYMSGQMKTMGDMVVKYTGESGPLCPGPKTGPLACKGGLDPLEGILPLALFTVVYTIFGGLPASVMTDQIQALAIFIIVIIVSIFVFTEVDYDDKAWEEKASVWTDRGFEMGCSLCFAVFGAEVFNLAFWQRVFMAKDDRALRIGIGAGTFMLVLLTFLFGLVGLLLKAQDESLPEGSQTIFVPAFTLFQINTMKGSSAFIRMMMFILAVCMITSCVDSFQIGITSVLSRFLQKKNIPYKRALAVGVCMTVLVNIPAVALAQFAATDTNEEFNGLAVKLTDLFSMADIVTITTVVPVFSGLGRFATTNGCLLGMFSGMATVIVWGWVEFGTFIAGLEMITMMCFGNTSKPSEFDAQGAPYPACGFYSKRSPMIFPTILVVTCIVTYTVSWMERVVPSEIEKDIKASEENVPQAVEDKAQHAVDI